MNDRFTITLKVSGRELLLSIPREEEEEAVVRAAVLLLNKKAEQYRQICEDKTKTELDFLAMAAVQITREYLKERQKNDTRPFEDCIRETDERIAKLIKEILL